MHFQGKGFPTLFIGRLEGIFNEIYKFYLRLLLQSVFLENQPGLLGQNTGARFYGFRNPGVAADDRPLADQGVAAENGGV